MTAYSSSPSEPPDPAPEFALHAWIDESMHDAVPGVSEPMYLLAAAVADPIASDPVRAALKDLLPGKKERLHWRDEDDPLRRQIALAIGDADFCGLVVVGIKADHKNQERARRLCMENLMYRLEGIGVSQVWIENRTATLNQRDLRMVDALRSKRIITKAVRVDFAHPMDEPMLWIPDAVAGASGMARKGRGDQYRDLMQHVVEEFELDLD